MKTKLSFLRSPFSVLLIAAAVAFSGCNSDDDEPIIEQHDTTYEFGNTDPSKAAFYPNPETSLAKRSADSVEVRYVYIKATGNFNNISSNGVTAMVNNALKPLFILNPAKFKGGGSFNFEPGVASQAPADSTWLAQNGYIVGTIR